jgi:hypothetical protein
MRTFSWPPFRQCGSNVGGLWTAAFHRVAAHAHPQPAVRPESRFPLPDAPQPRCHLGVVEHKERYLTAA